MSRSWRRPVLKDKYGSKEKKTKEYWRTVRRVSKDYVRRGLEPPNPKVIINDYNYIDYICHLEPEDGWGYWDKEGRKIRK